MKSIYLVTMTIFALAVMMFAPIIVKHTKAFFKDVVDAVKAPAPRLGLNPKQAGFITLLRPYAGYQAGQIVELPKSTEDALIAAGQATNSAGPPTTGPLTTIAPGGACAIAAGQSSVTITNPAITAQSIIYAMIAQAAADATLTSVVRVLPAAGSFTIYGNANATATVTIDWAVLSPFGNLSSPT